MLTLPSLLTTARRFVDGVCAIPELVDTGRVPWNPGDPISAITRLVCARDCAQETAWEAEQQLAAEREAHEETKQRWATVSDEWGDAAEECIELRKRIEDLESDLKDEHHWRMVNHDNCNRLGGDLNYANEQLSAARADLEALTKWRLNLTEPCPELPARTPIVVRIEPEHEGQYVEKMHVFQTQLAPNAVYRHTPESLDAIKQRDAERNSNATA